MSIAKLVLAGLLVIACHAPAKADYGNLGMAYLFGYGGYGGYGGGLGMQAYIPAPPYFALHPPVYYGQRYTRPYGASPFAAWPQLQANPNYAPRPQVDNASIIVNPYCGDGCAEAVGPPVVGVTQVAPAEPLVIDNPHYEPAAKYTSTVE